MENDVKIQGTLITNAELYQKAKAWAERVKVAARANASSFPTHGKTDERLSRKTNYTVKKSDDVVSRVYFHFPLHGAFRTFGVGRGQPAVGSKKVADRIYTYRTESDWMTDPLDRNTDDLAAIVADYYGDAVLKTWSRGGVKINHRIKLR